ncbi:MAG TPA: hypothetical protein VM900_12540 [Sphingomonas sp.]|nr:hypothetical protein [Sphingomonas sp.]
MPFVHRCPPRRRSVARAGVGGRIRLVPRTVQGIAFVDFSLGSLDHPKIVRAARHDRRPVSSPLDRKRSAVRRHFVVPSCRPVVATACAARRIERFVDPTRWLLVQALRLFLAFAGAGSDRSLVSRGAVFVLPSEGVTAAESRLMENAL